MVICVSLQVCVCVGGGMRVCARARVYVVRVCLGKGVCFHLGCL